MSLYDKYPSRVVRVGITREVVRMLNSLGIDATAYSVARSIGCSHPTARKYLELLANAGMVKREKLITSNRTRVVYRAEYENSNDEAIVSLRRMIEAYNIGSLS